MSHLTLRHALCVAVAALIVTFNGLQAARAATESPLATTSCAIATSSQTATASLGATSTHESFALAETTQGRPGTSRVWIGSRKVASFDEDHGAIAKLLASRLNMLHAKGLLRPDRITPGKRGREYVVSLGTVDLIRFDDRFARRQAVAPSALTLQYVNQLRTALGGPTIQNQILQTASRGGYWARQTLIGLASWYGGFFQGRRAADGSRFDQNDFTAAHKSLPLGTLLMVTNVRNQVSTIVRITDRGPYVRGRMLDLSRAAAQAIGLFHAGVGKVRITVLKPQS